MGTYGKCWRISKDTFFVKGGAIGMPMGKVGKPSYHRIDRPPTRDDCVLPVGHRMRMMA
jgi:hypothetical protein